MSLTEQENKLVQAVVDLVAQHDQVRKDARAEGISTDVVPDRNEVMEALVGGIYADPSTEHVLVGRSDLVALIGAGPEVGESPSAPLRRLGDALDGVAGFFLGKQDDIRAIARRLRHEPGFGGPQAAAALALVMGTTGPPARLSKAEEMRLRARRAAMLHAEGQPILEIARQLGVSAQTIRKDLQRASCGRGRSQAVARRLMAYARTLGLTQARAGFAHRPHAVWRVEEVETIVGAQWATVIDVASDQGGTVLQVGSDQVGHLLGASEEAARAALLRLVRS